jgi:hypothetical protein
MGWKSTYTISKEVALQVVMASLFTLSNEKLESILEIIDRSDLRNFRIQSSYDSNEDFHITSVNDF